MKSIFVFLFCLSLSPLVNAEENLLRVFVSVPPQKFLVESIGKEDVQVSVMLKPGEAPETFDPSPKLVKDLAGADIYFLIGVPFENNWKHTLQGMNSTIEIVPCCKQLFAESNTEKLDPHVWSSLINAKYIADVILQALIKRNVQRQEYYRDNHKQLIMQLDETYEEIKTKFAHRRTDYFITAHASWGYFARDYGLQELALEREGHELGPKGMVNIIKLAKKESINVLFVQEQFRTPVVDAFVNELKAKTIILDPLAENYLENMHTVAERIAIAIK